ncbi:MAG: hypothetical protein MI740_15750, partial [Halanaerobiales bacterium]|nr:hypothetical protein [Halanaerobiales bacterium]
YIRSIILQGCEARLSRSSRRAQKHTDFTSKDIDEYLNKIRKCVRENKYSISLNENRNENMEFIEDYRIDTQKEKEILLSLTHKNFCYAVDNNNPKFPNEKLYVFCKRFQLENWGLIESVNIYIKTNKLETKNGDDFVVVISMHKLKKPMKFLFK